MPPNAPLSLPLDEPFILFDDARGAGAEPARLYRKPVAWRAAESATEIEALLDWVRDETGNGLHAAGYLSYEAGMALEPRLRPLLDQPANGPLAWFGLFERAERIDAATLERWFREREAADGGWIGSPRPDNDAKAYRAAFLRVKEAITDGDIYQANLTIGCSAAASGNPVALYARLRREARAGHGALVHDGQRWTLSLSPELFFTLEGGRLTARPMKGTMPRQADPDADRAGALALRRSPKDRAENLMIVDLLRNDLARVAVPGSVAVPALFALEAYPTLHQMTSTVTARLQAGRHACDTLRALFPCGSITGAPKIRAMELLRAIENRPRGIYCGSIGWIEPPSGGSPGDAAFNVAIRTLQFDAEARTLRFGLGSGVVADSQADSEWQECLSKGVFVAKAANRFDLIETMRFDPASGIARLELHLERMKESARHFGYPFDRHALRNDLNALCFHLDAPNRVRILLGPSGATSIEIAPAPPATDRPWRVALCPLPVDSNDPRLAHKTTDRAFYDDTRRRLAADLGVDEVLFHDTQGRLTEGSFTHVYVSLGDQLATPPLALGLLPGVLRRSLLEEGRAEERVLTAADLADGFLMGNSLRGLVEARLIDPARID